MNLRGYNINMKRLWKWGILFGLALMTLSALFQTPESVNEIKENPMRALWLRPKETTIEQVEAHVEQIKQAGMNTIFLETIFHGQTIFPVDYDATYQNPYYKGFDVLQAYIDACHNRGMQLHCWVESFCVGSGWYDNGGPIVRNHPEWLLTNQKGENWEDTMYGKMYFLNPARPEAREWIVGLYELICKNYDIDGIQLDYVRYPEKTEEIDYGYDTYTLRSYNVAKSTEINTLVKYKQQMVTEYVKLCSERLRSANPDIIISLSVYPFYDVGEDTYMQSAQEWMNLGYGDLLVPMAYYENLVEMLTYDALYISKSTENTVIGICSQNGFTLESLMNQAECVLETGAGVAIFEFESFFHGYAEDWGATVFDDTLYNIDPAEYASKIENDTSNK
jgi:uncharacterized lipoprotein YddW (UPF0748 family)